MDGVHCFWCLRTEIVFCGLTMRQLTVESLSRSHPCPPLPCTVVLTRIPDFWDPRFDQNTHMYIVEYRSRNPSSSSFLSYFVSISPLSSFRPLPRIVSRTRTHEQRRGVLYPQDTRTPLLARELGEWLGATSSKSEKKNDKKHKSSNQRVLTRAHDVATSNIGIGVN
jgi:hypothetical protein